jgi:hypothetical protein
MSTKESRSIAARVIRSELKLPLFRDWHRELDSIHRSLLCCAMQNAACYAIDQWEAEREERQRREFFGGGLRETPPSKEEPRK